MITAPSEITKATGMLPSAGGLSGAGDELVFSSSPVAIQNFAPNGNADKQPSAAPLLSRSRLFMCPPCSLNRTAGGAAACVAAASFRTAHSVFALGARHSAISDPPATAGGSVENPFPCAVLLRTCQRLRNRH